MLQGRGLRGCWRPARSWRLRHPRRQLQRCLQRMPLHRQSSSMQLSFRRSLSEGIKQKRLLLMSSLKRHNRQIRYVCSHVPILAGLRRHVDVVKAELHD